MQMQVGNGTGCPAWFDITESRSDLLGVSKHPETHGKKKGPTVDGAEAVAAKRERVGHPAKAVLSHIESKLTRLG